MSRNSSRGWALALVIALTGMGLGVVAGLADESRNSRGPEIALGMVVVGAIYFALIRGPVGTAIARMLEGEHSNEDDTAMRVYDLESRINELTVEQQRVAELEERVDFTERLLAQREKLSAGGEEGRS